MPLEGSAPTLAAFRRLGLAASSLCNSPNAFWRDSPTSKIVFRQFSRRPLLAVSLTDCSRYNAVAFSSLAHANKFACSATQFNEVKLCLRRDSNPHLQLRRLLFYPLNYEGPASL